MKMKYTVRDLRKEFPNDDVCLEWLVQFLYPAGIECRKCGKVTKHHRIKSRKSYSCDVCGHHVHPTAGTIYHKSSTPLTLWFEAIFIMSSTRCGTSAKQLERTLGVTYKTAWRMFKQIRMMLAEDVSPLTGEAEVDETYVGGKGKGKTMGRATKKVPVVGAVQRGGAVSTRTIQGTIKKADMLGLVESNIEPGTVVYTDEHQGYTALRSMGYKHYTINHGRGYYVDGAIHTNTIEGFWSLVKNGIRGTFKSVRADYLQSYVNEYAFRYNRRNSEVPMFQHFMAQTAQLSWWTPYKCR